MSPTTLRSGSKTIDQRERRIFRALRAINAAAAYLGVLAATALVWAQFRGYDLLDGAYYFQVYEHPADDPDTQTHFQIFARPVWLLCCRNIVAFRLVCLAVASVICCLFWRAFRRLVSPTKIGAIYFWSLWLATIAGMAWVPVALTYNSLSTLFGLLGMAMLLIAFRGTLQISHSSLRPFWILSSCLFFIVVALYLVKPPAAAAFVAAGLLLLCCHWMKGSGHRHAVVATVMGVAVTVTIMMLVLFRSAGISRGNVIKFGGLELSPAWLSGTLERYGREIAGILPSLGGDMVWTVGPTLLVCCVFLLGHTDGRKTKCCMSIALGLLLASFLGAVIQRHLWRGSFAVAVTGEAARFYFVLWCSLLPIWIICRPKASILAPKAFPWPGAWITILLILPLIGSFGSTNTPYVSALHETVFWVAGLLILAGEIGANISALWFRGSVAAVMFVGAAGHIFSGHFLQPYMYQPSLWKQTEDVEIGYPPTTLKVNHELASFINDIRGNLGANGYKPGDDVFGFFNLPGVIFAVGASEPGAPWYFGTWYHQDDTDGGKLRRVPLARRQNAFIISQGDLTQFRELFHESGINFPDGYDEVGQTRNPVTLLEIGVWKPHVRR